MPLRISSFAARALIAIGLLAAVMPRLALAQGGPAPSLALTPPMGWNSWNKFGCDVSEQLIRETADAMVRSGMRDAGYQYVNIDDCWHGQRDSLGFIQPDPARFPSGMKALADYVHARGLKLGIYSDAGSKTCGGKPGSRGYERQDALMYAKWGVDYLKYDWCNTEALSAHGAYLTMHDALAATGRPIVLSICEWGTNKPWEWGPSVGQLWRTTGDIGASFAADIDRGNWKQLSVLSIIDLQPPLRRYAGPGHWNDPDMLEVGNGLTPAEDRAHFAMWSMLAAPLIAGNDLRSMPPAVAAVLMNRDVIAVNQDSLGIEGFRYSASDSVEIWFKPLARGDWAMTVLNRAKGPRRVAFDWQREVVSDSLSARATTFATTRYALRNLWTKREMGTTGRPLAAEVPAHDVLMLRLRKL
ncbi:MAG TPA: glycoside hydrolase family 27 protein [Gemmatimonadaceae bacterium]|nr:glycoside hydrolase family 27 protein [Gemmatimonadaceae bacterium]